MTETLAERSEFDPVYRALLPRARRVARREVPADVADDVAQQALLAVFERAAEFTAGRPCLPWFYAIVGNTLRTITRRAHKARVRGVAVETVRDLAGADDPEAALAERELRRALDLAIAELDETSACAIAILLGETEPPPIPPATWRKRVSRAYARLRAILEVPGGSDV